MQQQGQIDIDGLREGGRRGIPIRDSEIEEDIRAICHKIKDNVSDKLLCDREKERDNVISVIPFTFNWLLGEMETTSILSLEAYLYAKLLRPRRRSV